MSKKKNTKQKVNDSRSSQSATKPSSSFGVVEAQHSHKDNVKVFVRVRPQVQREIDNQQPILVKMPSSNTTILTNPNSGDLASTPSKKKQQEDITKAFQFDQSIDSIDKQSSNFKSQNDTYDIIGKDALQHSLNGFNTCIFAYGQTGSGKSYTMMGSDTNEEELGIIPRVCEELFTRVHELLSNDIKITVNFSYFEVYNEQVKDLLESDTKEEKKLKIRESPKQGPYIENLSEFSVQNYEKLHNLIVSGNRNRTTGATKMNDQSSRSHAVATLSLKITEYDESQDVIKEINSSLRMVDLAGSERANSTGASGIRFKEGSNINKSLTTLGRVISSLSKGDIMPPYRDSILTWILKESLGGNSKTVMIACISPCDYEETLSTLRYATVAKTVKLNAIQNVDEIDDVDKANELIRMKKELEELKENLEEFKQKDDLIVKFTQMSKFFEKRLIEQTDKYELIRLKYFNLLSKTDGISRNFEGLMNVVTRDDAKFHSSLVSEYNELLEKSIKLKMDFKKDLELFA